MIYEDRSLLKHPKSTAAKKPRRLQKLMRINSITVKHFNKKNSPLGAYVVSSENTPPAIFLSYGDAIEYAYKIARTTWSSFQVNCPSQGITIFLEATS